MTIEQAIMEAVHSLPVEQQRDVLAYADQLRHKAGRQTDFKSLEGLWEDLHISLSAEEIEENQREMWGDFASAGV